MQKIKDFCNIDQQKVLTEICVKLDGFEKSSDNAVTRAVAGLIWHLSNLQYTSPDYLRNTTNTIIKEITKP